MDIKPPFFSFYPKLLKDFSVFWFLSEEPVHCLRSESATKQCGIVRAPGPRSRILCAEQTVHEGTHELGPHLFGFHKSCLYFVKTTLWRRRRGRVGGGGERGHGQRAETLAGGVSFAEGDRNLRLP